MSARTELEADLRNIVGKGLREDAYYPVVAPKTPDQIAQVIQVAGEHHFSVLVLGNESSQAPQLSALRENILVILNVWLTGIEKLSPFSVRVLSGTPVSSVVRGGSEPPRKTIGGLICGTSRLGNDASLSALWPRVRSLEVITAGGELQKFATPATVNMDDPATANFFLGSHGKLGVVASVELTTPLPVVVETQGEQSASEPTMRGESLIALSEVQKLLDPNGLFHW
jgi:FAD/FMN-containing dehydrogenase